MRVKEKGRGVIKGRKGEKDEGKGRRKGGGSGVTPLCSMQCAYILFDLFISICSCEKKQHTDSIMDLPELQFL